MILKKLYHGNLKVCQPKNLLLLSLLILVFLHQLSGTKIQTFVLKHEIATFTPANITNIFIVYELDTWSRD